MSESLINEAPAEESAPAEEQRDFVVAEDTQPERPEWLPEKYKTPEDLAKAYKELESKIGSKEEDIRAKILEEINAEAFEGRPETAGDYQLPETIDESAAVDNELLKWWSEHSYENGYTQEEFEQGIEMYAKAIAGTQPDMEAEAAKLGDNAHARIESASAFANKFFPKEALPAIERMCETHEGILALEAIQEAMKDGSFANDTQPAGQTTEAELREMMNDPRYWKDRDPHFIKQVTEGFQQIFRG
jgi:hypothetical protein